LVLILLYSRLCKLIGRLIVWYWTILLNIYLIHRNIQPILIITRLGWHWSNEHVLQRLRVGSSSERLLWGAVDILSLLWNAWRYLGWNILRNVNWIKWHNNEIIVSLIHLLLVKWVHILVLIIHILKLLWALGTCRRLLMLISVVVNIERFIILFFLITVWFTLHFKIYIRNRSSVLPEVGWCEIS